MQRTTLIIVFISMLMGQDHYARQDAFTMKATYFPPLDTLTMAAYWETTAIHSEAMYNGDGSWGFGYADWANSPYDADVPLVRVLGCGAASLVRTRVWWAGRSPWEACRLPL